MPMLQRYLCGETKVKLKENKVSEVVAKMKCELCGHMAEDLDDDGYCEDCVIELGISRAEAIHDID